MAKEKRVCQWCGKEFMFRPAPSRVATGRGKYCSKQCLQRARNKKALQVRWSHPHIITTRIIPKQLGTCLQCGEPITNERNRRFCSRQCYLTHRSRQPKPNQANFTCSYCGQSFTKYFPKCRQIPGYALFCSVSCANKAQRQSDIFIPRICQSCGIEFMASRWHIENRRHGKFCSIKCRTDAYAISQRGEGNSNWRGGHAYEYGPDWFIARKLARKRDVVCQVCGAPKKLSVHHIVRYVQFSDTHLANNLTNLITLCAKCHPKVERGHIPLQLPFILVMAGME